MESSCPYSAEAQEQLEISSLNHMPVPNQLPHPTQSILLSTDREESSIPMSGKYDGKVWIYPSEQQFYNAMKRKAWDPNEKDMSVVVPIHNAVNEQAWRKILEWESPYKTYCAQPKLLKFQGKPKEVSLRARFWNLFGYSLPFDRHDWIVDRCGESVVYIIDFYSGNPVEGKAASFYLDVRPSIFSIPGIKTHFERSWEKFKSLF